MCIDVALVCVFWSIRGESVCVFCVFFVVDAFRGRLGI